MTNQDPNRGIKNVYKRIMLWQIPWAAFLFSLMVAVPHNAHAFTITSPTTNNVGLVGWWTMDGKDTNWATGQVTDKSGNGNTGQMVNMSTSTSPVLGKAGQGLKFDGTSYIDVTNESNFDFERTNPFSISAWIYYNPNASSVVAIASKNEPSGNGQGYKIFIDGLNRRLKAYIVDSTGASLSGAGASNSFSYRNWHHVVMTYDGSSTGSGLKVYADGSFQFTSASGPISGSILNNRNFEFGAVDAGAYKLNGMMDDVRIYNRALSASEIQQLYNATQAKMAVSTVGGGTLSQGLVGWWTMDGKDTNWATGQVTDKSGNGNTGQMVNMSTSTSPVLGKVGQALNFDGVDDIVNTTTSSFNNIPAMSISFWIKPSVCSISGAGSAVINKSAYLTNGWGFWMSSLCSIGLTVDYDGATNLFRRSAYYAMDINKWSFWTVTWDGSPSYSNIHIYKNGVEDTNTSGATNGVGNRVSDTANSLTVGNNTNLNRQFQGSIDDLRIYNRALSASEIQKLYNIGK